MKILTALLLALSLVPLGFTQARPAPAEPSGPSVFVSSVKPLHFGDDHNSEGFLAPLPNGKIALVFRVDPGIKGNHVGMDAYIAQTTYDPVHDQWSEVSTVYDMPGFDDRNIHGGVTRDGRIVAFFRRFDGHKTEGRYFVIHSGDQGRTWSQPPAPVKHEGFVGTGQMFYDPDIGKYGILTYGHKHEIWFSRDGLVWDEAHQAAHDPKIALSEIAGAWAGHNRIIALIRDDARKMGHPLLQIESRDNGQTWTTPVPTNIPPKQHWGAAPQLIYDQKRDLLIALNSDRISRPNDQNSIFIYTAHPEDVFGHPENWTVQHELKRPWATLGFKGERPLNQNLYGYPTIAPINDDEYLVVFTERAVMDGTEQADLYYFRILLK